MPLFFLFCSIRFLAAGSGLLISFIPSRSTGSQVVLCTRKSIFCSPGALKTFGNQAGMSKQGDSPDYEYWRQLWECQRHVTTDFHLWCAITIIILALTDTVNPRHLPKPPFFLYFLPVRPLYSPLFSLKSLFPSP